MSDTTLVPDETLDVAQVVLLERFDLGEHERRAVYSITSRRADPTDKALFEESAEIVIDEIAAKQRRIAKLIAKHKVPVQG